MHTISFFFINKLFSIKFPTDGDLTKIVYPFWDGVESKSSVIKRFSHISKDKRKIIIYDNGTEFSSFKFIKRYTKMMIYFAYPYHS